MIALLQLLLFALTRIGSTQSQKYPRYLGSINGVPQYEPYQPPEQSVSTGPNNDLMVTNPGGIVQDGHTGLSVAADPSLTGAGGGGELVNIERNSGSNFGNQNFGNGITPITHEVSPPNAINSPNHFISEPRSEGQFQASQSNGGNNVDHVSPIINNDFLWSPSMIGMDMTSNQELNSIGTPQNQITFESNPIAEPLVRNRPANDVNFGASVQNQSKAFVSGLLDVIRRMIAPSSTGKPGGFVVIPINLNNLLGTNNVENQDRARDVSPNSPIGCHGSNCANPSATTIQEFGKRFQSEPLFGEASGLFDSTRRAIDSVTMDTGGHLKFLGPPFPYFNPFGLVRKVLPIHQFHELAVLANRFKNPAWRILF